jgi:hypothetical protein
LSPSDSFDHEIEGGLFHVSLEDHPVYETVSYVVSTAGIIFFFSGKIYGSIVDLDSLSGALRCMSFEVC